MGFGGWRAMASEQCSHSTTLPAKTGSATWASDAASPSAPIRRASPCELTRPTRLSLASSLVSGSCRWPRCLLHAPSQDTVASRGHAPLCGPSPPPPPAAPTLSSSSVSSSPPALPTLCAHLISSLQHRDTPYNNPKVRLSPACLLARRSAPRRSHSSSPPRT